MGKEREKNDQVLLRFLEREDSMSFNKYVYYKMQLSLEKEGHETFYFFAFEYTVPNSY